MIEDLALRGGRPVNVLTGISLHGALGAALAGRRNHRQIHRGIAGRALAGVFGLPVKFDNDTIFLGNRRPNSFAA